MTLRIEIRHGEVVTWRYTAAPHTTEPPPRREPIRFDPEYYSLVARVRRIFGGET